MSRSGRSSDGRIDSAVQLRISPTKGRQGSPPARSSQLKTPANKAAIKPGGPPKPQRAKIDTPSPYRKGR